MSDWISGLPDPVLVHILSLVPTKEAVSTCLLSKRWTSLWHHLTKLEFIDRSFGSRDFFLQSVDAALVLVDLAHVQSFVMRCDQYRVPDIKIRIWLQALLLHNSITHLELHFLVQQRVKVPPSVFKCNTITILKLSRVRVGNFSTVDFPSLKLKVLHLRSVKFSSSECFQVLLSHCLHLEELVLRVTHLPYEDLPLHIERIEHLLLADVETTLFPMEAFSNVQFLRLSGIAINLALDFPTFHKLIHLEIDTLARINWTILTCLQSFPKLQSLVIYSDDNVDDAYEEERFMEVATPEVPPCISSHLQECAFVDFRGGSPEFEFVRFIMEHASVLRTVIMARSSSFVSSGNEDLEMLKTLSSYAKISAKCRLIFETSWDISYVAMKKYLTIRKSLLARSY